MAYPDTGNLVKAAVGEQLVNMARELDVLVSRLHSLVGESGGAPSPEAIDKFFRQDLALTKDSVDRIVSRVLEYIASGRMNLLDSKDLIFQLLNLYEELSRKIEAAVYRLKLIAGRGVRLPEVSKYVVEQARLLSQATTNLVYISRQIGGSSEAFRRLESSVSRVVEIEREADRIYREALDVLLDAAPDYKAYVMYRDVLDNLEDAVDVVERLAKSMRILSIAESVG